MNHICPNKDLHIVCAKNNEDSSCTNRMTHDQDLFKELDTTYISKVRIGNGLCLAIKGKNFRFQINLI